jgi:hypothetical protein
LVFLVEKRLPTYPKPREQQFAGSLGLIVATSNSGSPPFGELHGAGAVGTSSVAFGGTPAFCAIAITLPNTRPIAAIIARICICGTFFKTESAAKKLKAKS